MHASPDVSTGPRFDRIIVEDDRFSFRFVSLFSRSASSSRGGKRRKQRELCSKPDEDAVSDNGCDGKADRCYMNTICYNSKDSIVLSSLSSKS